MEKIKKELRPQIFIKRDNLRMIYQKLIVILIACIFSFETVGYSLPDAAYRTKLRPLIGANLGRVSQVLKASKKSTHLPSISPIVKKSTQQFVELLESPKLASYHPFSMLASLAYEPDFMLPVLKSIALNPNESLERRNSAIEMLGILGTLEAGEVLNALILNLQEVSLSLRSAAIEYSGYLEYPPIYRLLSYIKDNSQPKELREAAIRALEHTGTEKAISPLRQIITDAKDKDSEALRQQAIKTMGRLRASSARNDILKIAENLNESRSLRREAVLALGGLEISDGIERLSSIIEKLGTDADMREAVAVVIGTWVVNGVISIKQVPPSLQPLLKETAINPMHQADEEEQLIKIPDPTKKTHYQGYIRIRNPLGAPLGSSFQGRSASIFDKRSKRVMVYKGAGTSKPVEPPKQFPHFLIRFGTYHDGRIAGGMQYLGFHYSYRHMQRLRQEFDPQEPLTQRAMQFGMRTNWLPEIVHWGALKAIPVGVRDEDKTRLAEEEKQFLKLAFLRQRDPWDRGWIYWFERNPPILRQLNIPDKPAMLIYQVPTNHRMAELFFGEDIEDTSEGGALRDLDLTSAPWRPVLETHGLGVKDGFIFDRQFGYELSLEEARQRILNGIAAHLAYTLGVFAKHKTNAGNDLEFGSPLSLHNITGTTPLDFENTEDEKQGLPYKKRLINIIDAIRALKLVAENLGPHRVSKGQDFREALAVFRYVLYGGETPKSPSMITETLKRSLSTNFLRTPNHNQVKDFNLIVKEAGVSPSVLTESLRRAGILSQIDPFPASELEFSNAHSEIMSVVLGLTTAVVLTKDELPLIEQRKYLYQFMNVMLGSRLRLLWLSEEHMLLYNEDLLIKEFVATQDQLAFTSRGLVRYLEEHSQEATTIYSRAQSKTQNIIQKNNMLLGFIVKAFYKDNIDLRQIEETSLKHLGIITANRPDKLRKILEKYEQNIRLFGYSGLTITICDDSTEKIAQENKALVERFLKIGLMIRYIGPDEKKQLKEDIIKEIVQQSGKPEGEILEAVELLLRRSPGGNRNWVFLTHLNKKVLISDDDFIPETLVMKGVTAFDTATWKLPETEIDPMIVHKPELVENESTGEVLSDRLQVDTIGIHTKFLGSSIEELGVPNGADINNLERSDEIGLKLNLSTSIGLKRVEIPDRSGVIQVVQTYYSGNEDLRASRLNDILSAATSIDTFLKLLSEKVHSNLNAVRLPDQAAAVTSAVFFSGGLFSVDQSRSTLPMPGMALRNQDILAGALWEFIRQGFVIGYAPITGFHDGQENGDIAVGTPATDFKSESITQPLIDTIISPKLIELEQTGQFTGLNENERVKKIADALAEIAPVVHTYKEATELIRGNWLSAQRYSSKAHEYINMLQAGSKERLLVETYYGELNDTFFLHEGRHGLFSYTRDIQQRISQELLDLSKELLIWPTVVEAFRKINESPSSDTIKRIRRKREFDASI